ncbi:MAG TPA: calcium:proton antiporter [Ignavibacteria bacterium]|nr:calcium:proton antiporter [Ignavibacteria bacterium]HRF65493.1 calcium:proton antiporter [Ignavibacteria bacterium]HRJ03012.1 calcium:proton antiporter [Ignavibacteria bacterium]HRJ84882.1 calcium:proton antiporter [Ignavibacteria bacterium]
MVLKFFRKELSFIIAVICFSLLYVLGSSPIIKESLAVEAILFILVFSVIIYAALGVVHHAELLAYKFGEPYGTMILTLSAVTVEIIMIATMMLHGDSDPHVARDTIFSTLMILLNGLTGLIMLIGGIKYGEQKYNLKSTNSFFSMIFGIVGIGLFLPLVIPVENYALYETFLIIVCLLLYIFFLRMQSKEHNYYFKFEGPKKNLTTEHDHLPAKKDISSVYHFIMLLATIGAISILAESLSVYVDDGIEKLHLPAAAAGLIIAIIIVSPEALTAIRAGLHDDMQRVINISLGSMLSTVSLTIPAVLIIGLLIGQDLILGLSPIQSSMVIISLLVGILTCKDGESNALQGFIHFILFLTFVFLIFV